MIWYALMFNKEREDNFNAELNMTEYLASFSNPEAVKQTREARDNKKVVSDADFEMGLRKTFGRDFNPENMATASRADIDETPQVETAKKKGNITIDDLRRYTGLELDEVKFIPNKK